MKILHDRKSQTPVLKVIASLDNTTNWGSATISAGAGGTSVFNATGGPFGSGCFDWTSPSPTDTTRRDYTATFTTRGGVGVWIKDTNNYSSPTGISVYVSNTAFTSYMIATCKVSYNGYGSDSWRLFWIPADQFAIGAGSPTFEGTTWDKLRIAVGCGSGVTNAAISIGSIVTLPNSAEQPAPFCCLTMDDSNETDYTVVYPALQDYGLRATTFVIPSTIDTTNYLKTWQLKAMYNAGWDICAHDVSSGTWTMANATEGTPQTAKQVYNRIKAVRDYLLDLGFERSAYYAASPGGAYDQSTVEAMAELGMRAHFRTGPAPSATYSASSPILIAPQNIAERPSYELGRVFVQNSTPVTGAMARAGLTATFNSKAGIVYGLHAIGAGGIDWTSANFTDFLTTSATGLAARVAAGQIKCGAISDFFAGDTIKQPTGRGSIDNYALTGVVY
jgi:peptidoglycan/xylan/chitin deacetylase (PgdA/CDA1 family)